jgi:hypothetical protein
MKNALAIIGGLIAAFSTVPYLIDIVRRKSKPNIVTWTTWTLLTAIATAAAFASHEPRTAILTLGSTICTGAVVILGIKYGIAKMSLFDGLCQAGAIAGLILWLLFNSPTITIAFSLSIDFIVMLPTLRHAWNKPQEETWQTFFIGVVSSIFTLASLSRFTFASLAFPIYLMLANSLIVATIINRRKVKGLSLAR